MAKHSQFRDYLIVSDEPNYGMAGGIYTTSHADVVKLVERMKSRGMTGYAVYQRVDRGCN